MFSDNKSNMELSAEGQEHESVAKDDGSKEDLAKHLAKDEKELEEEASDFTPSIIIGVLLVIPVVLLLVITLVMRMHHRGQSLDDGGIYSVDAVSYTHLRAHET